MMKVFNRMLKEVLTKLYQNKLSPAIPVQNI